MGVAWLRMIFNTGKMDIGVILDVKSQISRRFLMLTAPKSLVLSCGLRPRSSPIHDSPLLPAPQSFSLPQRNLLVPNLYLIYRLPFYFYLVPPSPQL
jgi:hypothetical protein